MTVTRDKDVALANIEGLRKELALYTSVAVPQDLKHRTTVTRVGRMPSATHTANVDEGLFGSKTGSASNGGSTSTKSSARQGGLGAEYLPSLHEWQYSQDEMTLDEMI